MTSSPTAPQTCPSECAATVHPGAEHDATPCCGKVEVCRDCPTD